MLFSSLGFLIFFVVLVPIHYAVAARYRWVLLLVASVCFYASVSASFLWLLAVVGAAAYGWGIAVERRPSRAGEAGGERLRLERARMRERGERGWGPASTEESRAGGWMLAAGVITVLAPLLFFKYYGFLTQSLAQVIGLTGLSSATAIFPALNLPAAAGLSFFTLSAVSYLVDVSRGQLPAVRHPGHLFLYVAFFPKLLAGPIARAKPFLEQIRTPAAFSADGVVRGLQLMLWGLFKKVVIADGLAAFVDAAYGLPAFAPPADLVIATYFFAFQLYCDFSGYSDIAIGASRVLGIDLMENFRRPYLSTNVAEFWSARWHISLAVWFRDYLYIPLGGSRVSPLRRAANVMAVFLVSGLWHGANWTFLVWGGLNGVYTFFSRGSAPDPGSVARGGPNAPLRSRAGAPCAPSAKVPMPLFGSVRPLQRLLTFHLILISWVFFRASSLADAATIFRRTLGDPVGLLRLLGRRVTDIDVLIPIALIAVLLIVEALDERRPFWERLNTQPIALRWAVYYAMVFGLIVFGTWNLRQFVYMQF